MMTTKLTTVLEGGVKAAEGYKMVDLRCIRSNEEQSRGEGVCPRLMGAGYDLFKSSGEAGTEAFKPAIMGLLLSDNEGERQQGLALIEQYEGRTEVKTTTYTAKKKKQDDGSFKKVWEPVGTKTETIPGVDPALPKTENSEDGESRTSIVRRVLQSAEGDLADSMTQHSQLQPIYCTPFVADDGTEQAGQFNVVYGGRRMLAAAMRTAKSGGKIAPQIEAKIGESRKGNELYMLAIVENLQRKDETVMDKALNYRRLKEKFGMDVKQIAEATGQEYHTVRLHMQCLNLPQVFQKGIKDGTIAYTTALKVAKEAQELPLEVREQVMEKMRDMTDDERDVVLAKELEKHGVNVAARNKRKESRRRLTVKWLEGVYEATEQPDDCDDKVWEACSEPVRKFLALILEKDYQSRAQLKKALTDAENKKLQQAQEAAKARQDAEKLEQAVA
jgi:ParB/RepB/Spo0J family partition protein